MTTWRKRITKDKKLDHITIGIYTKFYPMYYIYKNYFIFIIYFGYHELVQSTSSQVLYSEMKNVTNNILTFLRVKHKKLVCLGENFM